MTWKRAIVVKLEAVSRNFRGKTEEYRNGIIQKNWNPDWYTKRAFFECKSNALPVECVVDVVKNSE